MQGDVQRNVNQEKRIDQRPSTTAALPIREAGKLEKGSGARYPQRSQRHARNGNVSAAEQRRLQRSENRQSKRTLHTRSTMITA